MKEIILNKPFVNLPKINLTSVASFSLVSKFYEKEMAMRNGGIDLNSSESIKKITDNAVNI